MERRHFVFLALVLLNIQSCWVDPCNPDCGDSYGLFFRIVSKSTGSDLVFGPNKIFDRSQIKVFSVKGRDTILTDVRAIYGNSPSDSTLYFYLQDKTDTVFLRLNAIDIDTINITYGMANSRCCTFNTIQAVNYNNSGLIQTKDNTVDFKK